MTDKPERTLIVVFDVTDRELEIARIRQAITSDPDVINWWNHIPGTFLVTTDLGAEELADRLKRLAGDARFLIMQVSPTESEGWLPERAWRWIRRRSRENVKVTVTG